MAAAIVVENLREREALGYPLVLLEGRVICGAGDGQAQSLPRGCFLDARLDSTRSWLWPVATSSGAFKAFVLLPCPGVHAITLRLDGYPCQENVFEIEYRPPATRYVVRFYYQKCCDGESEGFDAPPGVDNSDAAAIRRVQLAALLLQTATGEMLHRAGLSRKSFSLEFEADGLPAVQVLRSSFSNSTARSISDQELIQRVKEDIMAFGLDDDEGGRQFKHEVILGCSKYNTATRKAEAHAALGGERVGVFASCGLHTWPPDLADLTACCLNNTRIDPVHLLDDSCYRGTFWANFSTGIGAFIHELGHTFGLGHSTSGIMSRGFDDMNRLFTVYEISAASSEMGFTEHFSDGGIGRIHLNYDAIQEVKSLRGAHWNLGSAAILKHCPWISTVPKRSEVGPSISWDDSVRGPVGQGSYDGEQKPLPGLSGDGKSRTGRIGGVLVDADRYLNNIETFSRDQVMTMLEKNDCRSYGSKHLILLMENEYIRQVDVRAMAWIDGIQIHTNLRSTSWFGGFGGKLHSLKLAEGYEVAEFFGSRGNAYVGTLGVHCQPISNRAALPSIDSRVHATVIETRQELNQMVHQFPTAGLALESGPRTTFDYEVKPMTAIVIKCDRFVEAIHVIPHEDFAVRVQHPTSETCFHSNEHIFDLLPEEHLVAMEVKSGHWVDAIRFRTSLRNSAWFGGPGGNDRRVMECPRGHFICGLSGLQGPTYVGSISATYSPALDPVARLPISHAPRSAAANQHLMRPFSILNGISSDEFPNIHAKRPIGVLLGIGPDCLTFVHSFETAQEFGALVEFANAVSTGGTELYCLELLSDERIIQIDVSMRSWSDGSQREVIDGICFHTTSRCSEWIGAYRDYRHIKFLIAPQGWAVQRLTGESLVDHTPILADISGHFSPLLHLSETSNDDGQQRLQRPLLSTDERVKRCSWTYDVRIGASTLDLPIDTVTLVKKKGEHLDCHAWSWPASDAPNPVMWCMPQKILESGVNDSKDCDNLLHEYVVGAIDMAGGFNKVGVPPSLL